MDVTDAELDEEFLLALLNSTPVVDGAQLDELATAATGRSWLRMHRMSGSAAQWQATRAARERLQAVVRGHEPAASLTPLLIDVSSRPSVTDEGVQWRLDAPKRDEAAVRAVLAWDAVRRVRPGRLRPCANPECALFLLDRSKANRARWCSMAVCGNRMKARRHYERTRPTP